MARVLLGVTGGIAAYKAAELCRLLVKAGHDVVPILTPGAERFVARPFARSPAAAPLKARTRTSNASTSS
jgi:phosphopantothenoylcysteine decarboxylase / phosphopantothenate---cysteine ligase